VAYADTTVNITGNDCIGVVFGTAPEKYNDVLTYEQFAKGEDKEVEASRNIQVMV
jgi:hypothetical protein